LRLPAFLHRKPFFTDKEGKYKKPYLKEKKEIWINAKKDKKGEQKDLSEKK